MKQLPFPLPRHGPDDDHAPVDLSAIHFPDHHGEAEVGSGPADAVDEALWKLDNVEMVTVGVDVGSSTSHLIFARLHLQRLSQSLSSRFAVVKREVLHRSPILITPYRPDGLIDAAALERFVESAYRGAGLRPAEIDTGAVILTGAALERANARAVAELFAGSGGRFVCASAGHNLEAILAAHGSGAVALSHRQSVAEGARNGYTLLHVDIGGGTSKLSLVHDGEVLETAAVSVGGRLLAFDADGRAVRIEPAARLIADRLGLRLALGRPLAADDRARLVEVLMAVLLEAMRGRPESELGRAMVLTEPLAFDGTYPRAVTFSGGVAEYLYGRETAFFDDLGPDLAGAVRATEQRGELPAPVESLGEGIRATVIGASQFTVQLSGNTVHIPSPAVLPLRNLPVVHPRLPAAELSEEAVEAAVRTSFRRLDLTEGEQPVAVALAWRGEPCYAALRALAGGLARALPRSLQAGFPLVIALQEDIGRSLGGILDEEFDVRADLVSVDGLQLRELDYVDVGELIEPAHVVPVVVKSLAFAGPNALKIAARLGRVVTEP